MEHTPQERHFAVGGLKQFEKYEFVVETGCDNICYLGNHEIILFYHSVYYHHHFESSDLH